MMLSNNLESDLEALHIHVVDKPAHEGRYQIDEDALREELKSKYSIRAPSKFLGM